MADLWLLLGLSFQGANLLEHDSATITGCGTLFMNLHNMDAAVDVILVLALHSAEAGMVSVWRALHRYDPAMVNARHLGDGQTALMIACRNNRLVLATFLLDQGADLNLRDEKGSTALLEAVGQGHTRLVSLLLSRGADASICQGVSISPLALATVRGHVAVVKLLLRHDIAPDVDGVFESSLRPVDCAALGSKPYILCQLLEAGAEPDRRFCAGIQSRLNLLTLVNTSDCSECIRIAEDWRRAYLIYKARRLHDGVLRILNPPAAAKSRTRGQVKQSRCDAAPAFLKQRLEESSWADATLPAVKLVEPLEVAVIKSKRKRRITRSLSQTGVTGEVKVIRHAVLSYLLEGMNEELFMEVMGEVGYLTCEEPEEVDPGSDADDE